MNITIPLYVEERSPDGQSGSVFIVRPLFFVSPVESNPELQRAITRLAGKLRHELDGLGRQLVQWPLAEWTFSPEYEEKHLELVIPLKRLTARCKVLAVSFDAMDRRVAFLPALPMLWFDLPRGSSVRERAAEVIGEYLRRVEKEEGDAFEVPEALLHGTRAFTTAVELDVHPKPDLKPAEDVNLMALFSAGPMSGRHELNKVGRCLDWLYPDELDRAVLRDAEVDEVARLLEEPQKRPVLLVGRRRVGKTAIVHEAVWRRVAERKQPHVEKRNVWLLSPSRLISGMMYVGQWENRLLAILDEARKKDHVLYFDDLLGLYTAGVSRNSDLNVAAVMRPYVERRDFRMLAEITPEALRVLRERDRPLADAMHILPIREPAEAETRRVLISVTRQLEGQHRCRFALDALPAVLELTNRYARDAAQPGKSAGFLRQLALKHRNAGPEPSSDVRRESVLADFHDHSGLSVTFLDSTARLEREQIVAALRKQIVAQDEAVAAMADVVCVARARLNDPGRPLGSLLFLGPTGVGKTQCAKALAAYLFGDAERMVRFDLNEFVDAASVARLVGTFYEPEGLLTGAIRRRPFSVVLLDEVEKAHPAVFDLLLQVLGEGRLTDALGRTADFANAIIIMTSNLGAREAATHFGLRPTDPAARAAQDADRQTYLNAAEGFFRPEFFNRIDRIVPFRQLTREEVAGIAQGLIRDVFRRDGLVNRRCVLQVEPSAMDRIVAEGYHPQLGARALKRSIERQLAQPVGAKLATIAPEAPAVISLYPREEGIAVAVQPLLYAERREPMAAVKLDDAEDVLDRVEAAIGRIEPQIDALEPPGGATHGKMDAGHYRYFALREQAGRIRRSVEWIDGKLRRRTALRPSVRPGQGRVARKRRTMGLIRSDTKTWRELISAQNLQGHLAAAAAEINDAPAENIAESLAELVQETSLLDAMAGSDAEGRDDRCLVTFRALEPGFDLTAWTKRYERIFGPQHGSSIAPVELPKAKGRAGQANADATDCVFLAVDAPGAAKLLAAEAGTHLLYPKTGALVPIQTLLIPLSPDHDPAVVAESRLAQRARWRADLAHGRATPDDDPFRLGPVIRIYDEERATVDLRTGLVTAGLPTPDELRRLILAQLEPPGELT